jgi:hypothetical protein
MHVTYLSSLGIPFRNPAIIGTKPHTYLDHHQLHERKPHTKTMRVLIPRSALLRSSPTILPATTQRHVRYQSSTPSTAALPPRWLSDVKSRIGKCINFGISSAQSAEAGSILQETSSEWRDLVAGSEGFLTSPQWRGLYRQEVVWGEMVCLGLVQYNSLGKWANGCMWGY